jgi:hypothetical protein
MVVMKWLALVPVAMLAAAGAGLAQRPSGSGTRVAACAVARADNPEWPGIWRGHCAVRTEPNGSLIFRATRGRFPARVELISLVVASPGVAEVRVTTRDGVNAVWGEARQSEQDPACWLGEGIRVCAY